MEELVYYYPKGHELHAQTGHPERPQRVEEIVKAFRETGLWESYLQIEPMDISLDFIATVHSQHYINELHSACRVGEMLDMDTYTTPASWQIALATVGGAVALAEKVWHQAAHRGFALTRPPGHHATRHRGMGFCLLNNIALAAQYLITTHQAQRLAILDFDLHHGNGTQDIFYDRKDVFYISTHQSPLYPGSGMLEEIGAGEGKGFTANFPLPPGSGDEAFQTIMGEVILALLEKYQPEMLLISYGFDSHWRDPLGHLQLSAQGYGELIAELCNWADEHCQGRVAIFLEGGYDLDAARACSLAVVLAMLGQKWEDPLGKSPRPESQSWKSMLAQSKQIWNIF
ncbi:MAG: histone deacetylase [Anaerolineales bacterium]